MTINRAEGMAITIALLVVGKVLIVLFRMLAE
jgi:hypothetical protein